MPVAEALHVGQNLELARRHCTLAKLRLYHGPAQNNHTDYAIATGMGLKAPVAGGILLLAHLSEALCALFGRDWLEGGRVDVKFLSYVYPEDTILYQARVKEIGECTQLEVECKTDTDRLVMVGNVEVRHDRQPRSRGAIGGLD